MNRLIRTLGFMLIAVGAIVIAVWFIEPLREVWPWYLELPLPIRIGLVIAGIGLLLLVGTVIWERIKDREGDRKLLDDDDF
jgi:type VI protein secretion system component VasK